MQCVNLLDQVFCMLINNIIFEMKGELYEPILQIEHGLYVKMYSMFVCAKSSMIFDSLF